MKRSTTHRRAPIDWQAGRTHIARTASLMEEALSPSPHRVQAIMDERARVLARTPPQPVAQRDERDFVVFLLAGERYAIETLFVHEVIRSAHLASVPIGAEMFLGFTNLRGEILGVVDLHKVLGLPATSRVDTPWLIVLGESRGEFAVPVEAVEEVKPVRTERILDPAEWTGRSAHSLVRGVSADALIFLEGQALLTDPRLFAERTDVTRNPMRDGVRQ
jgi:purine-binding chemotaxis protein CheW